MLQGYDGLLKAIAKFRNKEMDFNEYKQWLIGSAGNLGYQLEYQNDWYDALDAWLESIEFCYPESDWYELGCSLGAFLKKAIETEPRPLRLPDDNRVIREQFRRARPTPND